MNRLLSLVKTRVSHKPQGLLLLNCYRAPKGGKQEVPQGATTDYIGIFKDRPEPKLRDCDEYPDWLFDHMGPKPDLSSLIQIWKTGEKSLYSKPTTNEVLRLLHNLKKVQITDMNYYRVLRNMKNYNKRMPPEEESEDLFELLQGVKKGKTDDEGEEEEEEEEDEEEEAPKRKGPGVYEDEKETAPPPGAKGQSSGKKK